MPDEDTKRTTERDLENVSAGAKPEPELGPDEPGGGGGGGGGQLPGWQQPDRVDVSSMHAAGTQPKDISAGPEDGSDGDGPEPRPIDVHVPGAGVQPQNLGDTGPTPVPGDPSIKVKVQDADLTSDPGNADA